MSGLIEELKRRNVFKIGAAYVVLAWLLAQITDVFLENFGAPDWVIKTVLLLLVVGFPLAVFFAWAFEMTPEGIKKEKDVDRSQSITSETGRKLDFVIIAVLIVALGYFAVDKFMLSPNQDAPVDARKILSEPPATTGGKSVAVLPFVNMSSDPEQEYFSDGISEEILNALARVNELQVAGRTSSFVFKGRNQDLREIGETLGVEHILEGSVRKAGNTVRITAQLIRVDNGFHLWSETYDRELTDVFAIQDEIASAILVQLKAKLVGDGQQVVTTTRTDSEVYDLYLLARQRMYERSQLPLDAASGLLDRAIALDPGYAPAYAQKGIVTLLLADNSYGDLPQAQAESQGKLFLDQALRLDPQLAEAWAGLGLYHYGRPTELEQGIEALKKALAINPNLIDATNWLNNAYNNAGRPADALALLQGAVRRDPIYKPAVANLVFQNLRMGRRSEASELVERTRPFMPKDPLIDLMLAQIEFDRGEIANGLKAAESALLQQPNDRVYRVMYSMGLEQTHQNEKLAREGYRGFQVRALQRLDRIEEASILAQEHAASGDLVSLFSFLNETGRSEQLIGYLETRWADLESFENDFPAHGFFGYREMVHVALAYRRSGRQAQFAEAMQRTRTAHDSLRAQGVDNPDFMLNEAAYYAMADQAEQSLHYLAAAIDRGIILSSRISDEMPFLIHLEGDPEYEAIQARMLEHLARERKKLGLEPLSA